MNLSTESLNSRANDLASKWLCDRSVQTTRNRVLLFHKEHGFLKDLDKVGPVDASSCIWTQDPEDAVQFVTHERAATICRQLTCLPGLEPVSLTFIHPRIPGFNHGPF